MQLRNSAEQYGAIPQLMHWLTVLFVVLAWLLGTFIDEIPRGAARAAGLYVHNTAGLAIMLLLVLRLAWRLGDQVPHPEITPLGAWGERAAKAAQVALYLLLAAIPVVGIVLQFARGDAVPVFGLFEIASPWTKDRAFARSVQGVHEVLADALIIIAL